MKNTGHSIISSNELAIAEAKKWFPDLNITIDPTLDNAKTIVNPKKLSDIKKLLARIKVPLSEL